MPRPQYYFDWQQILDESRASRSPRPVIVRAGCWGCSPRRWARSFCGPCSWKSPTARTFAAWPPGPSSAKCPCRPSADEFWRATAPAGRRSPGNGAGGAISLLAESARRGLAQAACPRAALGNRTSQARARGRHGIANPPGDRRHAPATGRVVRHAGRPMASPRAAHRPTRQPLAALVNRAAARSSSSKKPPTSRPTLTTDRGRRSAGLFAPPAAPAASAGDAGRSRRPFIASSRIVPATVAVEIQSHPKLYPGVKIVEHTRRDYPAGTLAAHLVGHVGRAAGVETQVAATAAGQDDVDEVVGLMGVERAFDAELGGRPGVALQSTDHRGKLLDHRQRPRADGRPRRGALDRRAAATFGRNVARSVRAPPPIQPRRRPRRRAAARSSSSTFTRANCWRPPARRDSIRICWSPAIPASRPCWPIRDQPLFDRVTQDGAAAGLGFQVADGIGTGGRRGRRSARAVSLPRLPGRSRSTAMPDLSPATASATAT